MDGFFIHLTRNTLILFSLLFGFVFFFFLLPLLFFLLLLLRVRSHSFSPRCVMYDLFHKYTIIDFLPLLNGGRNENWQKRQYLSSSECFNPKFVLFAQYWIHSRSIDLHSNRNTHIFSFIVSASIRDNPPSTSSRWVFDHLLYVRESQKPQISALWQTHAHTVTHTHAHTREPFSY